ncbi:MAG: Uma2 family endonuclease [Immundisolibacterales bacterium]|nr:Uma2 family endonuclease [Immundisolibacterales bacterium]
MSAPATSLVGPLGSTIHVLRADAATIAELAGIDWSRHFGRVSLDPARGLITLMSPSRLHDDLSEILDDIVDLAADAFGRSSKGLRMTRLRPQGDPPGTGLEPDCSFYIGERADRYRLALMEGEAAADAFLEETGPDLVVEVEVTQVDKGKIERYAALGAREFWQIRARRGEREVAVDFFALHPDAPPRPLAASVVLQGLTPDDVREAIEPVRFSRTVTERLQAVARIVRRRREARMRVREEDPPPYSATRQQGEDVPARPHQ